jgi:hypothetical protein
VFLTVGVALGSGSRQDWKDRVAVACGFLDEFGRPKFPEREGYAAAYPKIELALLAMAALANGKLPSAAEVRAKLPENRIKAFDKALTVARVHMENSTRGIARRMADEEVERRLPTEQQAFITKVKEALEERRKVGTDHGDVMVLRKAFADFMTNQKAIMMALHPDRAPTGREDEFSKAMALFNGIKDGLDRLDKHSKRLLAVAWPKMPNS